ncbi:MAG: hypothetical protein ABIO72_05630 [Patescibacteria group bacterium]
MSDLQYAVILEGVKEVISIAGATPYVPIRSFRAWRMEGWRVSNALVPYRSIDWYVAQGRESAYRTTQLDCEIMLHECIDEPWQNKEPHYDMMVVSPDLHPRSAGENANFVLGMSIEGVGTVLSTYRFISTELNTRNATECFKTTVMHELGHVFGLVKGERAMEGHWLHRQHCPPTRRCIMRQGLSVKEWALHTRDRLEYGPFCPDCVKDLQSFFR